MSSNREFVSPYYLTTLHEDSLYEMLSYISELGEDDFKYQEIAYEADDQYRSCSIHYPSENSLFYNIGKPIFMSIWIMEAN